MQKNCKGCEEVTKRYSPKDPKPQFCTGCGTKRKLIFGKKENSYCSDCGKKYIIQSVWYDCPHYGRSTKGMDFFLNDKHVTEFLGDILVKT